MDTTRYNKCMLKIGTDLHDLLNVLMHSIPERFPDTRDAVREHVTKLGALIHSHVGTPSQLYIDSLTPIILRFREICEIHRTDIRNDNMESLKKIDFIFTDKKFEDVEKIIETFTEEIQIIVWERLKRLLKLCDIHHELVSCK